MQPWQPHKTGCLQPQWGQTSTWRCRKPLDAPTSERAIPVIIFSADPAVARAFLRRWTGDTPAGDVHTAPDVREFIDWGYYRERISSAIQKIVTIPAAYQVRRRSSVQPLGLLGFVVML